MARKKLGNQDELLKHSIRTRVNDAVFKKLQTTLAESNCHSIGELVRKIISNQKIGMIYRDMTLHGHIQELARIREELRSIGTNVNQITHYFHAVDSDRKKIFYALVVADQYAKVSDKVALLMEKVDTLGEKWLQRTHKIR
jgi:hypothetical protein